MDDNAPTLKLLMPESAISTSRIEIAENTKPNSVVAQLTAADVDSKKLRYHLSGGSPEALDNFRIVPQVKRRFFEILFLIFFLENAFVKNENLLVKMLKNIIRKI